MFQNEGILQNEDRNKQPQNITLNTPGENSPNRSLIISEKLNCQADCHVPNSENREDPDCQEESNVHEFSDNFDTLLHPADFKEFNRILNVSPVEGNHPLSLFQDKFSEYLCFHYFFWSSKRGK